MTLNEAEKILEAAGIDDARHEARIIFATVGGEPLYKLLTPSYKTESEEAIKAVYRRADREPLAYIIGSIDFYNESYIVTPDCLIPRSDTELLVDIAVSMIPDGESFIDIGTGSGCVALSTLRNTKNTTALAVDISEGALSVAKKNAELLGVSDRVKFLLADATLAPVCDRVFAVLSNPPYVADECYKTLEPEIFKEPKSAFVGGNDGGDFYRVLTPLYRDIIDPKGFIAYEIGFDQADMLRSIAEENKMSCRIYKDMGARDRVALLRPLI
ncbi:MAG: peptide chain release factor N(5)-glutamine methyltransferase [Clostridia bacterium]|nr:peptide chain release factor N(5)-glutamine methyltransferase [Clostridia bacterium]